MEEQKKIYPIIKNCYQGGLNKTKYNTWTVNIRCKGIKYNKNVKTKDEAFEHLKQKNIEFELPIKNIVFDMGEYYEVELTQGQRMKFDKEDLDMVQKQCLNAGKSLKTYYCKYMDKNHKQKKFHNDIMKHTPTKDLTVDHINHNGLDNRKSNLRIATIRQQATNKALRKTNTTGVTGINKNGNYFKARWTDNEGKERSKSFNIDKYGEKQAKEMAILYRQDMIKDLAHYSTD